MPLVFHMHVQVEHTHVWSPTMRLAAAQPSIMRGLTLRRQCPFFLFGGAGAPTAQAQRWSGETSQEGKAKLQRLEITPSDLRAAIVCAVRPHTLRPLVLECGKECKKSAEALLNHTVALQIQAICVFKKYNIIWYCRVYLIIALFCWKEHFSFIWSRLCVLYGFDKHPQLQSLIIPLL